VISYQLEYNNQDNNILNKILLFSYHPYNSHLEFEYYNQDNNIQNNILNRILLFFWNKIQYFKYLVYDCNKISHPSIITVRFKLYKNVYIISIQNQYTYGFHY
jgi:hypothetical protein